MLRRALLASLPLAVLSACTVPARQAETSAATPAAAGLDANLSARGEYLARIAGCNDCHTPGYGERGGDVPKDAWLTGSPLGFSGPWGTTYPANLRLKAAEMDETGWVQYTGNLHTRPPMPDYNVRDMTPEDRRALYRFLRTLGPAGDKAPAYLPPGQTPPLPYMQMVLPPAPAA
jgi:mono/diheme cytochrome c family protein